MDKFVSLRLETVSKYITKKTYNEFHPNDKFFLLEWATHQYRVAPLMKALKEAKVVEEKHENTTMLLDEELKSLLAHDNSVTHVFKLLELQTDLLASKNPNIETLQRYMEMFNTKHSGNQQGILPFYLRIYMMGL
ncbi:hypothetical protein PsorP6_015778 [Peronosclerospora sorghi]|uniref:Uncharacterized protein n=1 Tax=Peronosclerospora sorghi TaxID=230839 RepID=A0ACC0WQF4_9STRA|nr:hypothetical protein PsorP6_015778 [Peronosclerospora sorghi]